MKTKHLWVLLPITMLYLVFFVGSVLPYSWYNIPTFLLTCFAFFLSCRIAIHEIE